MEEIWKDIQGYEGLYQVSNLGRVKSLTRTLEDGRIWKERILKPVNGTKYLQIMFSENGKHKHFSIHRLVAEAFIPNPDNMPCVNHKDENKTNNFVFVREDGSVDFDKSNLEWCTHEYNTNYGTCIKRMIKKKSKTVLQLRKDGSLVRVWPSCNEVQRQLGYGHDSISLCCRGKLHTAYGFRWCYA